jgi:hypothetical protein
MVNNPGDPHGWIAQNAAIAANRVAQQKAAEETQRAGHASQLDASRRAASGQGPSWATANAPGVSWKIKAPLIYVGVCLFIIFVLVIIGFFGAFR